MSKRKIRIGDISFSYAFERVMPGKFYSRSITDNHKCYAGKDKISEEKCKKFLIYDNVTFGGIYIDINVYASHPDDMLISDVHISKILHEVGADDKLLNILSGFL